VTLATVNGIKSFEIDDKFLCENWYYAHTYIHTCFYVVRQPNLKTVFNFVLLSSPVNSTYVIQCHNETEAPEALEVQLTVQLRDSVDISLLTTESIISVGPCLYA
jgi:hypothetical protein